MESTTNVLTAFIDKMLEEKEFQNLDIETQNQLRKDLEDRLENHVNIAILDAMSETDRLSFESLLDQNPDDNQLQTFLKSHIPDLEEIVAGTLLRFRNIYLEA